MNTDIRMMAFDMDGTLKGKGDYFPEINCRVLQECERRGIKLLFCSGRTFEVLRTFAGMVGVSPFLASANGACLHISPDGPKLKEHFYDPGTARYVFDILKGMNMYFTVITPGQTHMCNAHVRYQIPRCSHHAAGFENVDGFIYERIEDDERTRREGLGRVYKFVILGDDYDPRFEIIREKVDHLGLSISKASRFNLELMMPGVDKALAVRYFAEREGISLDNVMAFGDQTNDLPMLDAVGWPVAMENGEDCVKARARIIAPHHDEGGVGQVIERYVLNRG
ncbi:MAG: HAD-IIB family hydrolase [Clostridia bacterium]|nr:HAD-IIB family hydrolase [Clostridia bacterium]